MKKVLLFTIMAVFVLNVASIQAAEPGKKKDNKKETVKIEKQRKQLSEAEVQLLLARIDEISKMDVKSLPAKERRDLRREVRDIQDKLDQKIDGIYIGGGALLVILILLILLV